MLHSADSNGDQRSIFSRPEYQSGTQWVFDMDDTQRKAHAEEMSANAAKLRAQASEINGRCGWSKFRLCMAHLGASSLIFIVGVIVGILLR